MRFRGIIIGRDERVLLGHLRFVLLGLAIERGLVVLTGCGVTPWSETVRVFYRLPFREFAKSPEEGKGL